MDPIKMLPVDNRGICKANASSDFIDIIFHVWVASFSASTFFPDGNGLPLTSVYF